MIDLNKINELYNGDKQKVKKILTIYATILPDQFFQLEKAFDQIDVKKIEAMAHTLKTSFRYLGLNKLSNTAKKLEEKCESAKCIEKLRPYFLEIIGTKNQILENLNKLIHE
jgi:HPt (histidine-containing phosphotransfer) domain-containing protein